MVQLFSHLISSCAVAADDPVNLVASQKLSSGSSHITVIMEMQLFDSLLIFSATTLRLLRTPTTVRKSKIRRLYQSNISFYFDRYKYRIYTS